MKNINVKLEAFEGPFDLLFHLIEKNEINLYDIPISLLTAQFMEYTMNNRDMENISEFLIMASTLLEIKSKMLLPKLKKQNNGEDDIDPRDELVRRLIEYKHFKDISEIFRHNEIFSEKVIFREQDSDLIESLIGERLHKPEEYLNDISVETLKSVFLDVMDRQERRKDKIRFSFDSVKKDAYTIEKQIGFIDKLLKKKRKIIFQQIFENSDDKTEIVVTFLAILEMIKLKLVDIIQNNIFDEIIIRSVDEG